MKTVSSILNSLTQIPCDCQTGSQAIMATVESSPADYDQETTSNWSEWTAWGACNRSCGDGEQTRVRTCVGGPIGSGNCWANDWKGKYDFFRLLLTLFRGKTL